MRVVGHGESFVPRAGIPFGKLRAGSRYARNDKRIPISLPIDPTIADGGRKSPGRAWPPVPSH